jgi:hypothetical protein
MQAAQQRKPQPEPSPEAQYLAVYLDRIAAALETLVKVTVGLQNSVAGMELHFLRSEQKEAQRARAHR